MDVPLQWTEIEKWGPCQKSVEVPVLKAPLRESHLGFGEAELDGQRGSQDSPESTSCALGRKHPK